MKTMKRLASVLLTSVLVGVLTIIAMPRANAVTCYGDYCSGKDPQTSGCSAGAYTVASKAFQNGILEIRWSPTCKTNWARVTVYPIGWAVLIPTPIRLSAIQDTGYTQQVNWDVQVGEGTYWTPMIYSPVRRVKAQTVLSCSGVGDCAINAILGSMVVETIYV